MAKASIRSGTIKGHKWSETDNRDDLYELARDLVIDGLTSKLRKGEIVDLLVKVSRKKTAKKASKKKAASKTPSVATPTAPDPKSALAASRTPRRKVTKKPPRPRRAAARNANMPTGGARKVR